MVRLVALVLALCALAAPTASASKIKPIQDPDATATGLVTKFVTLVEKKDVAGLERFLAPGFQLQRADGSHATKTTYLTNLPNLSSPQIQGIDATVSGADLVVTYQLSSQEVINGQQFNTAFAPRLSVFQRGRGGWQIVAHANFNAPETK